ncbi:hypothetical protein [Sphingomonas sp. CFBP 13720]|nr:hypothetical protein [Sphingomonas sp. CFBP 13720]MBD8679964.1 hypothetical protein [Sphingomonas sp. CFBP 13720]
MDISREMLAYAIIAIVAIVTVPWLVILLRRRHRDKLRRRGIKRYGH